MDAGKERSLVGTFLRHPLRTLSSVDVGNIRQFVSVAHYAGFRAAVRTARHVLGNTMDDYERSRNADTYLRGLEDVPERIDLPCFGDPLVTVIVPAYNQYEFTIACLASVASRTRGVPYEVVLADDRSSDATVDIAEKVRNLAVSRPDTNLGFLRNCNFASRLAHGKYLLFLNNDTVVGEDWLRPMVDLAENNQKVCIVGSKLVYPDGKLQEAGCIIWSDGSGYSFGKGGNPNDPGYNYVKEVDYVSGASLLVRRDFFEATGGFDVRYAPAYCEDSDLCLRARSMGFSVLYQPLSAVVHFEGITHGKMKGSKSDGYRAANLVRLYDKWSSYLGRECLPPLSDVYHARDRSFGKISVLFVTDHIPSRSLDSGTSMVFRSIVLLARAGYSVKLVPADFHYDANLAVPLEQEGVEIFYGIKYRDDWRGLFGNAVRPDHIILAGYSVADRFMDYLKRHTSAKIHYYLRNNPVLGLERENGILQDAHTLLELATVKRHHARYLGLADSVICASREDADSCRSRADVRNVFAVPFTYFDIPVPPRSVTGRDIVFVGNQKFRPNADALGWFVREVLPLMREAVPGIRLVAVGDLDPETFPFADDVVSEPHLDEGAMDSLLASCQCLVNPMRISAGIVGTVPEAMYRGTPVVSTKVGLDGLDIEYPVFDTAWEITVGTVRIFNDPDYAEYLSDKGKEYVEGHFRKEDVLAVFEDFIGKPSIG